MAKKKHQSERRKQQRRRAASPPRAAKERRTGRERREATVEERSFLTDIQEIRRRARQHIQDGAVTQGYLADREKVIAVLNEALATEIVCVLRYKRHYFMATWIHANAAAQEGHEHASYPFSPNPHPPVPPATRPAQEVSHRLEQKAAPAAASAYKIRKRCP